MASRTALVSTQDVERVRAYLPANYYVCARSSEGVYVRGEDDAGWTLDDYVLPRLASGLMFGQEVRV